VSTPAYSLQTGETLPDETLLFKLAPAPSRWPNLAVIGGSIGYLADLSWLVEATAKLKLQLQPIVPLETQQALPWLQAIELPTGAGRPAQKFDDALGSSQVVIAGLGLQLTSNYQIILDRWLAHSDIPTVITDELVPLYKAHPELLESSSIIPCVSIGQLLKLHAAVGSKPALVPDRGIFNIGNLLVELPSKAPLIIAYEDSRIYTYVRSAHTVVHTPVLKDLDSTEVRLRLLLGLAVSYWASGSTTNQLGLVEVAHYLLASSYRGLTPVDAVTQMRSALEPSA